MRFSSDIIPEPTALALMGLAWLDWSRRRRFTNGLFAPLIHRILACFIAGIIVVFVGLPAHAVLIGDKDWRQLTELLRAVADSHRIVGFDVCELAPREGPAACSYTAAKLVYKLVAYATSLGHD